MPSGSAARPSPRPRRWRHRPHAPRRTGTPASSRQSRVRSANAVPLAERALALLSEGQDSRNLARLRTALGTMQLQLDPPDVARGAGSTSTRPPRSWPGRARARSTSRATSSLALGRTISRASLDACRRHVRRDHRHRATRRPLLAADAQSLAGQISLRVGDTEARRAPTARGLAAHRGRCRPRCRPAVVRARRPARGRRRRGSRRATPTAVPQPQPACGSGAQSSSANR